jgi:hypothetical protein
MVMNCADWPEDAAVAAIPPSRAAIRFSKTSTVGWCAESGWSDFQDGRPPYVHNPAIDVAELFEAEESSTVG